MPASTAAFPHLACAPSAAQAHALGSWVHASSSDVLASQLCLDDGVLRPKSELLRTIKHACLARFLPRPPERHMTKWWSEASDGRGFLLIFGEARAAVKHRGHRANHRATHRGRGLRPVCVVAWAIECMRHRDVSAPDVAVFSR